MNKLSIITINRNNAIGLRKTIESVVSQTYHDFEYIIIDGASTDESVDIIKQYAFGSGDFTSVEITFWVSESDSGIYNAMNKGILKAKGEYCMFLNSGDYLVDNGILEKVIIELDDIDIVYGNLISKDAKQENLLSYPDHLTFKHLYSHAIPHSGGSFIKRILFEKYGLYNESFKIVSDWEFFIKTIILNNATTKHINEYLSYFDLDGISTLEYDFMMNERRKSLESIIPLRILEDYKIMMVDVPLYINKSYKELFLAFEKKIYNKVNKYISKWFR